jgi:hypothetical protein
VIYAAVAAATTAAGRSDRGKKRRPQQMRNMESLTFGPFDFTIHVFNLKSTYIQLFGEITTTMLVRPQLSIVTSNYWEKRFVDGTNNSTLNQPVFN